MGRKTIVLIRHGEKYRPAMKEEDELTPKGAQQVFRTGACLAFSREVDDRALLICSGARRTWQSAMIIAAAVGIKSQPRENLGFHFEPLKKRLFGNEPDTILAEKEQIRKSGGNLATALEVSEWARRGREWVATNILLLAFQMERDGIDNAVVATHSPFAELAVMDPSSMPYGLEEADAVVYHVEDGGIVFSGLFLAATGDFGKKKP